MPDNGIILKPVHRHIFPITGYFMPPCGISLTSIKMGIHLCAAVLQTRTQPVSAPHILGSDVTRPRHIAESLARCQHLFFVVKSATLTTGPKTYVRPMASSSVLPLASRVGWK